MLQDRDIWRSTLLVALFNIALFSYYSLGPFVFQRLGLSTQGFGYSGVILALTPGSTNACCSEGSMVCS
jgi:hypothetical protein